MHPSVSPGLAFLQGAPLAHHFLNRPSPGFLPSSRDLRSIERRHLHTLRPRCVRPVTVALSASASASASAVSKALLRIQNGSDVRGVALTLPPKNSEVTFTTEQAREIAAAFVRFARKKLGLASDAKIRVAIGRDSRLSGPDLADASAIGAMSEGASVCLFGLATTPAMFMSTVLEGYKYDCAIMLTASHLPPDRNGMKFFTKHGSTDKREVRAILEDAGAAVENRQGTFLPANAADIQAATKFDFLPVYSRHLVGLIRAGCAHPDHYDTPLKGFKIVVDAGNGAAGFFAEQVLKPLGADVMGQYLEPDGLFPNHVPNPEDKRAMQMTIDATLEHKADLGIIFDTDVDRSGVVASNGMGINRNHLIALLARIVLQEHPGATIVTDSVTSNGLRRFIEQYGGKHFRYRKGYKNVIDKGIELDRSGTNTPLAIETSGHGAMKENYMLDDGAYLAVKIVIEMVRLRTAGDKAGIGGLLQNLDTPLEENEFRLPFKDDSDFQNYGKNVVDGFAKFAAAVEGWKLEETNYEGYRVIVDEGDGREGWLLLRQSLHDPLLPLNIESEIRGGVAKIATTLVNEFFSNWTNVDTEPLTSYISSSQDSSDE